jgi:hypothetical protein
LTAKTESPTLFPTLLPTKSPTQVAEIVRELYDHNGGCELPCVWGVVPGETTIQEVYSRFAEIGDLKEHTRAVDTFQIFGFTTIPPINEPRLYSRREWSFGLTVNNDTVIGIFIYSANIKEFSTPSLSKFLVQFGKPEEVWFTFIAAQSGDPDYEIALYYPSKGIFVNWRGTVDSVVSETESNIMVTVCPQYMPTEADTLIGSNPPFFYLFSSEKKMTFDEIIVQHLNDTPSFRMLDEASTQEFYDTYLNPNTQVCFPLSYP